MSKQDKELTMDELQKSLSDIFEGDYSEDEIADMIEKAKKSEDYDDEDGEVPGEQDTGPNSRGDDDDDDDEDMEKAYDKMKKAYDKKAKEMKDLEAKMKKAKGVKKSEDEDIEKAETNKEDIVKSLTDSFSKSFVTKGEYEDLSKSIEDMKETLGEIAKAPTGRRAIVNESQVIEKSEGGGSGNELSLTRNKRDLEVHLSNMIEKSEGASKIRLEKALINLNSGNVIPSVDILKSIESEQGVTFTK